MNESPEQQPEPTKMPTQEQLDAVNARLDALDAGAKRARNRERAMHSTPHREPPLTFVNRTLDPAMIAGGIDDDAMNDATVKGHVEAVRGTAKSVQEDLQWLQEAAAHFQEMAGNLQTPGDTSQRLLAATFGREFDSFISKITRVTKRLEQLDGEATKLEQQEQMHAKLARESLRAPMSPHVASEIRQWLRSMPDDSARYAALHGAIHAGDRELVHAVTETGVPPMMLGFSNRKMFDLIVDRAERKFGAEHVHRRESCRVLKEKTRKLREHLHNSSETTCAIAMLERHPALKELVAKARLK